MVSFQSKDLVTLKSASYFLLLPVSLIFVSCGDISQNKTENNKNAGTEAYNAGANETHLVVAAPLASAVDQKIWACRGNSVLPGTNAAGYKVSIGAGSGNFRTVSNQTTSNRNVNGSNLTPVGEIRISRMIPGNCPGGPGMLTRCIMLAGNEKGVNDSIASRGIYIHGTPSANYKYLGDSASHGCVRMNQVDIVNIYDKLAVGNRVYISTSPVNSGNPCAFRGDSNGRAR